MKIVLVKAYEGIEAGSLCEIGDEAGKALVAEGVAKAYVEKPVVVPRQVQDDPLKVGKAFAMLAGKAVTGMSEGTAADGGALVATGVSEVMGIAVAGSVAYAKCRKIVLPDRMNAIVIPVDASDPWIKANAPVSTTPAEGAQKTATKLAFSPRTLTLAKEVLYIPVTDELLSDVAMLDAFVRQYAAGKMAGILDGGVFNGSAAGLTAIIGDTGYTATQSFSGTPTQAELTGLVNKLDPRLVANAEFYCGVALWGTIAGVLGTSANIDRMLIDVTPGTQKLFGKKVNLMPQLNGQIVFADLSQYVVAEPRNADVMAVSESVRFDYDESVYRLVHRSAGAAAWKARTAADSAVVGAFVSKA